MKAPSKILIAYDGSACSDAALQDLRRAGLPPDADAVVLTVADVIVPPPDEELPGEPAVRIPELERHAREKREKAVKEARALSELAAGRVKEDFPGWRVKAEVDCGSPPVALIMTADRLQADLIVVGSHRHAVAGGRLILGSTSQRVLYDAGRSVRVARCSDRRRGGPVRIIVGFSGTPDADEAVSAA
ncbi:MAG: universal stress protein, partial [Acidobacteriota bacterium]|nr:universal stress protein [Acidobacteriota bacterium]